MYRAWSHWKAIAGGKHMQFLLNNNLLRFRESPKLDAAYTKPPPLVLQENTADKLLLSDTGVETLVKALDIPEVQTELDRAIFQVQKAIVSEAEKASVSSPPAQDIASVKEKADFATAHSNSIDTEKMPHWQKQQSKSHKVRDEFKDGKKHWKEETTYHKDKKVTKFEKKHKDKDSKYAAKETEQKKGHEAEKTKLYA